MWSKYLEIVKTSDGSKTVFNKEFNATYHSIKGAVTESKHVFIEAGLNYTVKVFGNEINILEVGFGTGLNAALTFEESEKQDLKIVYYGVEKFPLEKDAADKLEYNSFHQKIVDLEWNKKIEVSKNLTFTKFELDIHELETEMKFHCIYFDAFAPEVQPELWTEKLFFRLKDLLLERGCIVTYCAKGDFKRMLKKIGMKVETLPGAPGKREMTRAVKITNYK